MEIRKLSLAERKRLLDSWEKPLSMPVAVPKGEPKKRGRKSKTPTVTDETAQG